MSNGASATSPPGVPLAAVLHEAGLSAKSLYVRAEGNDLGLPPTAAEGIAATPLS